jgi:molybdopterin synthase sulfur carrier subunit
MVRVELPFHLRELAHVGREVAIDVPGVATVAAIIDAIELRYPMLRGTIRDHATGQRRPFLRFFACTEDLSFSPLDTPVPEEVASGREPLMIVGALAGG